MLKLELRRTVGLIWDEGGKSKIVQIIISHEETKINSLQFVYVENDNLHHSEIHGKSDGLKFNIVTFDYPLEFLTSVSGLYDQYGGLSAIAFGTNKCMHGPFGKTNIGDAPEFILEKSFKKFRYEFGPRSNFGGFHGIVHMSRVQEIGIYVKRLESLAELNPIDEPNPVNSPDEPESLAELNPVAEPNPVDSPDEPESLAELNIK